jgi:acylglycerol lipase
MGCQSSKSIEYVDFSTKCSAGGVFFQEKMTNVGGKRRNVASWFSEHQEPKGVVFIVHGLIEHSLCYYAVAHALVRANYCVFGMDHVSHGKSDGEKGIIRNHQDLYNDLIAFVNMKRNDYVNLPAFMVAHSMGTLAAIMSINHIENLSAVVFSGPALFSGPAASSPFGIRCLYPLSQTSFALCLTSVTSVLDPRGPCAPLDTTAVTSDPYEMEDIKKDPRRGKAVIANKTAKELLSLIVKCKDEVPRIALPFLCLHGADDQIALKSGSEFIFKNAGTELAQRRIHIFPGLKHDVFHELRPHGPESIAMVVSFLDEHCQSASCSDIAIRVEDELPPSLA